MTMLLLLLVLMMTMLLVLMIATPLRTPCLCLQPIRRELDFFFSEDRRSRRQTKMVVNGDRTRESVASKSVLSLLSCVAV
mmetsp:Transcript_14747/g.23137  ORF Transcript_14747/g.23137 Transcript_14747/m.23137 type:complete len:80 (+) Transcript_14747:196-435(+)